MRILIPFLLSGLLASQVQTIGYGGAIAIESDSRITLVKRVHGIIGFQDATQTITTGDANWHQVTNGGGNLFTDIDTDGTTLSGDTLYLDSAGDYLVLANLSFTGLAATDNWDIGVSCDGTPLNPHSERSTSNNSIIGNVGVLTFVQAIAGQGLTLEIKNRTQPGDPVVNSGTLQAIRLLH